MTDSVDEVPSDGLDRRSLLKKAAIGGVVVFAAPAIMSTPAWAAGSDCKPTVNLDDIGLSIDAVARTNPGATNYEHVRVKVVGSVFCEPSDICEDDPNDPLDGLGPAVITASDWVITSPSPSAPYFLVDGEIFDDLAYTTITDTWGVPPVPGTPPGAWPPPQTGTRQVVIIATNGTKDNLTRTNGATVNFKLDIKVTLQCGDFANTSVCLKYTIDFTYQDGNSGIGTIQENGVTGPNPC